MASGGTEAAAAGKTWRGVDHVSWLERSARWGLGADGCAKLLVRRLSRSGSGSRSNMAEAFELLHLKAKNDEL